MGVPCPCQGCTSGMTPGQWSDVLPRPLFCYMICALYDMIIMASLISVGAYGCILDLFLLSVICYLLSGECGCVCNTRPSQPIEVTPLFTSDILRSPLIMTMIMIIMKAFMKALLYLFLGSWLMTNPYLILLLFHTCLWLHSVISFIPYSVFISVSYYFVVISVHWAF